MSLSKFVNSSDESKGLIYSNVIDKAVKSQNKLIKGGSRVSETNNVCEAYGEIKQTLKPIEVNKNNMVVVISTIDNNQYLIHTVDLLGMLPLLDGNNHIKGTFIVVERDGKLGLSLKEPFGVGVLESTNLRDSPIPETL
ncbi:hypothetical protein N9043_00205 [bacterium]|nr:hypothetical protein [bacterium]